ncbi:hypothetical protein [Serratia odorifera]|jgi:hypothetical protein|uniref:Secreted protein n=2 Tax=Serratia odorifera TaxID=618 RepID=D4EA42_SEROD|nr:hypothetical protein [Serratia odorifera]EFE93310.1 hypothetical protein HMPREF0758_5042 [Serratia odorifera DSM 4582]PNK88314.1 hypothetical protein CEQ31_000575 [Serratia odorifera]RII73952.1 hypothetical protein DX901_00910 [Serratia odorifera]VDZ51151.1 Uncharacterised protein [Serratia odorifera]
MKKQLLVMVIALVMNTSTVNAADDKRPLNTDVEPFISALKSLDPLVGGIATDIVKTKVENCGQSLTVQELKAIMANDAAYHDMLASASLDKHYLNSPTYRDALTRHYGVCTSNSGNNKKEGF